MRNLNLVSFIVFLLPCLLRGQDFKVYDSFNDLESKILEESKKSTLVINFWATWCAPCVEELPSFEELNKKYGSDNFQVWLVSLDFKSKLDKQFVPFLERKGLKAKIFLLADMDADTWIQKMHPDWDGAVPATVIIHGAQKGLFPGKFENYQELESFVLSFLTNLKKVAGMSTNGGSR